MKVKFFESISDEIEGKFRRVSHLLKKANLKSGEYHEEILRNALSNFLSGRFSVKTGYIWLSDDKQSKQIDILIIDENCPFAYIFKEKDFVIVRPEAVVAVIEVKTVLKFNELVEGFENILSAKSLKHQALGHYGHIVGVVFGYESNNDLSDDVLDKWFKAENLAKFDSEVSALWPDVIFFFKNSTYLQRDANNSNKRNVNKDYYYKFYKESKKNLKAWQLSLLISLIVTSCEYAVSVGQLKSSSFQFTKLLDFDNAKVSFNGFRPKEGEAITSLINS